jgi:uncharacterized repeat protein (TIGR03803 family)
MKEKRKVILSVGTAFALAIILFTSAAGTAAQGQTFTVLYSFGGIPGDPMQPYYGPIAQGRDGNLYATTYSGGSVGAGTVFKITPGGSLTVLSNLGGDAGTNPWPGLTLGRDGGFYGTTAWGARGGRGTVFHIAADGKLAVLHSWSGRDGSPLAPPIQGADGNLYGTADCLLLYLGSIYKITPPHEFTTLHQFTGGTDGSCPGDPLLQATDTNFYGTASNYAFKISPTGKFTSLGPLPGLPGNSYAPLVQASNGSFYGVTDNGGRGADTVFQMSRTGKTHVLHTFTDESDGAYLFGGLVQATDGNFYGAAESGGAWGYGTIYRITPTGHFSVLYSFDGATGSYPLATLVQQTNGILYGETNAGGTYSAGVFYSLDIGAPPFVRLVSTFGKVAQTIGILGQGFTGTTDVSFNSIPATFTVSSDTYLEATVPTGATTGFVTVTTSTGTLTSNQQIQIRQ